MKSEKLSKKVEWSHLPGVYWIKYAGAVEVARLQIGAGTAEWLVPGSELTIPSEASVEILSEPLLPPPVAK
jgi:hypothetical protein